MKEMPKAYDHQIVESKWYEKWEKSGYFHAEPNPEKTCFGSPARITPLSPPR